MTRGETEQKPEMSSQTVNGDASNEDKAKKANLSSEEMTSKDYYFDSYAHFGKLPKCQIYPCFSNSDFFLSMMISWGQSHIQ